MRIEIQQQLLHHVVDAWRNRDSAHRPYALWIRQHDPLPIYGGYLETPLRVVWLLDERGLRQRSVWDYARFYAVQCDRLWCSSIWPEPNPIFGRVHEIGWAAFAQYAGTDDYYLEIVWGGLDGEGHRVTIDHSGLLHHGGSLWRA